jgi:hypothetical protein
MQLKVGLRVFVGNMKRIWAYLHLPLKQTWRCCHRVYKWNHKFKQEWINWIKIFDYISSEILEILPPLKYFPRLQRNTIALTITNILTYLLTELNPSWEGASCAATQEFLKMLQNPTVHYHVHKSPPLVPILSQIDPVHIIPSCLSKIYFNIVHAPTFWSS